MTAPEDTIAVLRRLQEVLERLRPGPQEIFDESALADPKPAIEAALDAAVHADIHHPFHPSQIQGWLVTLAQFQPNVGEPILEPASEVARRMADARARHERPDTRAIQREVDEASREEKWAARRGRHAPAVAQERTRLLGLLSRE